MMLQVIKAVRVSSGSVKVQIAHVLITDMGYWSLWAHIVP